MRSSHTPHFFGLSIKATILRACAVWFRAFLLSCLGSCQCFEIMAALIAQTFLLAVSSLILVKLYLNWSKHNSVPGPFLASISDLWRAYHQYRGNLRSKLLLLHKLHGPLVRYGINDISINDSSGISIIYGSRAGFVTVGLPLSISMLAFVDLHLGGLIQSPYRDIKRQRSSFISQYSRRSKTRSATKVSRKSFHAIWCTGL